MKIYTWRVKSSRENNAKIMHDFSAMCTRHKCSRKRDIEEKNRTHFKSTDGIIVYSGNCICNCGTLWCIVVSNKPVKCVRTGDASQINFFLFNICLMTNLFVYWFSLGRQGKTTHTSGESHFSRQSKSFTFLF